MSITGYKRLTMVLAVISAGLLVLCGALIWNYGWLKIRVGFASEQTRIFEEMRTQAMQGDAAGAAGCMQYVIYYYPSGSKQVAGSRLDRIVERERKLAIRDIIAYMRAKTGEDLGENPNDWLKKFGLE